MLQRSNPSNLPYFTILAGLLGFVLQLVLYRSGMDEAGLLATGHVAGICLCILSALVLLGSFLAVRKLPAVNEYEKLFPPSVLAGIGCFLAAAGIMASAIMGLLQDQSVFSIIVAGLAGLSSLSLILLGMCRKDGKRPNYLFHACLTVYLMVQLIAMYRHWSSEPQVLIYLFPLLASVFLMLTAYHATCLDSGKDVRRWYVFFNQTALFFCFLSLMNDCWLFYLPMGLWAASNLCSLYISKYRCSSKEA